MEVLQTEMRAVQAENKELVDAQQHAAQKIAKLEEELLTKQGRYMQSVKCLPCWTTVH